MITFTHGAFHLLYTHKICDYAKKKKKKNSFLYCANIINNGAEYITDQLNFLRFIHFLDFLMMTLAHCTFHLLYMMHKIHDNAPFFYCADFLWNCLSKVERNSRSATSFRSALKSRLFHFHIIIILIFII